MSVEYECSDETGMPATGQHSSYSIELGLENTRLTPASHKSLDLSQPTHKNMGNGHKIHIW